MMYRKPEVMKLALSFEAIQSQGLKLQFCLLEGPLFPLDFTPSAYEADE